MKQTILITAIIVLLSISCVTAATVSHSAAEVTPGSFQVGSYYFPDGNVGIGTAAPLADYGSDTVVEVSGDTSPGFVINDTGQASKYGLMADSNDLKITYGSGVLATFQNDGNVGIGTTGPQTNLHVQKASSGQTPYQYTYITAEGGSYSGMSILSTEYAWLMFGDVGHQYPGYIEYYHLTDAMNFFANSVKIMTLIDGNVGIGTTSPNVALDVIGSIEYTGTITDVSDIRLKENLVPITNSLSMIQGMKGYTFNMIDNEARQAGVIAQDVQKVLPEAVSVVDEEQGYLGVDYTQLVPVLIEAVKELKSENDELKQENQEIKGVICEIKPTADICQ